MSYTGQSGGVDPDKNPNFIPVISKTVEAGVYAVTAKMDVSNDDEESSSFFECHLLGDGDLYDVSNADMAAADLARGHLSR